MEIQASEQTATLFMSYYVQFLVYTETAVSGKVMWWCLSPWDDIKS